MVAILSIAGNGKIAIDLLRLHHYDLVILDVQMPVMDGVSATKLIRKEFGSILPIVGCSAHSLNSEKISCIEAGMNDYITKPYSEKDLVDAVLRNIKPRANQRKQSDALKEQARQEIHKAIQMLQHSLGSENTAQLILELQKRIPNDLEAIQTALQRHEIKSCLNLFHDLQGSFGSMQLKSGSRMCASLERELKAGVAEVSKEKVLGILEYLEMLQNEIRKFHT